MNLMHFEGILPSTADARYQRGLIKKIIIKDQYLWFMRNFLNRHILFNCIVAL